MRLYRLPIKKLIWIESLKGVLLKCEPEMIRSLKAVDILANDIQEIPHWPGWYFSQETTNTVRKLSALGIVVSYIHDQDVDFGLF